MDYRFPDGVVWQIGGFEVYDILRAGEVVGQAKVEYKSITMLDQPAYRVQWKESWVQDEVEHVISVDSKMLAKDLSMVMTTHTNKRGEDEWRYECNSSGGRIVVGYYGPGEAVAEEYSINKLGYYADAGLLPFLLRNIPFAERNYVTFRVFDVVDQTSYTPIASVTGEQVVETSATQYDCWVVNVSLPGGSFTAWYSKSPQHYLVKVRYSDREIVLNHHS